jgi:hypothetical protein
LIILTHDASIYLQSRTNASEYLHLMRRAAFVQPLFRQGLILGSAIARTVAE